MQKAEGNIEYIKITPQPDKFGKKCNLYTIKINEVFYSVFVNGENDPYCHYSEGDKVILEYEVNGDYKNIKSIKIYNPEAEKKYEEYVDNSLKKEIHEPIKQMVSEGIFSGEFILNGESYKISISKK